MILEAHDLVGGYGRTTVVRDLSLSVEAGQVLTILGPNGAGKSTLIRLIGGLLQPFSGRILFQGKDITGTSPAKRVRRGIAHVPEGRHLFGSMSVLDNLELGNYSRRGDAHAIDRVFALFPALAELRHLSAGALSGGQQQMLAIGRGLMSNPALLLMDEPSLGLAPRAINDILGIVRQLAENGVAVVVAEQNATKALKVATNALFLDSGRKVLDGDPAQLAHDAAVVNAYFGTEDK